MRLRNKDPVQASESEITKNHGADNNSSSERELPEINSRILHVCSYLFHSSSCTGSPSLLPLSPLDLVCDLFFPSQDLECTFTLVLCASPCKTFDFPVSFYQSLLSGMPASIARTRKHNGKHTAMSRGVDRNGPEREKRGPAQQQENGNRRREVGKKNAEK